MDHKTFHHLLIELKLKLKMLLGCTKPVSDFNLIRNKSTHLFQLVFFPKEMLWSDFCLTFLLFF